MDEISWLVPERVVKFTLPMVCDDRFLKRLDEAVIEILNAASESIHILADVREVKVYPSTQALFQIQYLKHRNVGRIITIGATGNPITRFLARLFTGAMHIEMRDFVTMEDAQAYLMSVEKL